MNKSYEIPKNMNNEEEIRFWETHDLLEVIDDTEEVEITVSQELKDTILARYRDRIKERTFNKYVAIMTTTSCMANRRPYLYMQTKSTINDNPDAKSEKKESYSYPRVLVDTN